MSIGESVYKKQENVQYLKGLNKLIETTWNGTYLIVIK